MRYENKKIRELCRGKKCYLQIPCVCKNRTDTVVPVHSPDYLRMHGKEGLNVKAHDIFVVPGCQDCHDVLDGRVRIKHINTKQDLQWFFDHAHAQFLVDIIKSGELKEII